MNIILCGLPMSGKTTVGALLAEKLKRKFIDTDRLIEDGRSCREIYREVGEENFRKLESEQIRKLIICKNCVIALGGGSLIAEENRNLLHKIGTIIYLKASTDTLWGRISQYETPSYLAGSDPKKKFQEMTKNRILIYEQSATYCIDIENLSPNEAADAILRIFAHGQQLIR